MEQQFEFKLIECLDAFERGEPLDSILSRYPEDAARLCPLLQTAVALPALSLEPARAAEAASRRSFLNQAAALRERAERRRWRLPVRWIAPLAALALVVVLFGQVIAASAAALPGDTLYPVKRTVEDVQLALTPDRASLTKQIEQERRSEVAALLGTGRTTEVEFAGPIESIERDGWVIAGLNVRLDSGTRIDGVPAPGRRAQIHGRIAGGTLTAISITVEPGGPPLPPTVTPTATVTSTPQPSATPTRTPRSTTSPTRTSRPPASPTAAPTTTPIPEPTSAPSAPPRPPAPPPAPSPTPVPQPTATAAPADDGNQNGDDNGNGNDNGNGDNGKDGGNDNGNGDNGGSDKGGDSGGNKGDGGGGGK